MSEETNPYESPAQSGQPVHGHWKKPALITLLLSSPSIVLVFYSGFGLLPALPVAIGLNFAIRNLKKSQPGMKTLPFFVLAMAIAGAYIIGLLSLSC